MKLALRAVAVLALLVVIGALGLAAHRAWRQHQLARAWRIATPEGIDDARFLDIGGRQEWVTLRGQDRRNPVILFLHGGPSEANSPFVGLFRPFERDYVMVQWDQPGAGRTYMRAGASQPKLSLDGIADDGVAVALQLRAMLHEPKIILIGQDWGGDVALRMAEKRPDLFQAVIDTGALVSWLGEQAPQYDYTLTHARAAHDRRTLEGLRKLGPPPYRSLAAYRAFGDCFEAYKAPEDVAAETQLRGALYMSQLSWPQMFGWARALRSGEQILTPAMMGVDLRRTDTRFQVPVFAIQGGDDRITPASLVADWLAAVQAPVKRLDVVPGAGHMVMWQQPQAFLPLLKIDLQLAARAH